MGVGETLNRFADFGGEGVGRAGKGREDKGRRERKGRC